MSDVWTDPDDRVLARSIFGTDDRGRVCGMIAGWVRDGGFGPSRVAAIDLSVGAAVTVVFPDRRPLFVKVWPGTIDGRGLGAQMAVQRAMHARGFPSPDVLTGPKPLGPGWAVAMSYDRSGDPTDASRPSVRRAMAGCLARLVDEADDLRGLDGLPARSFHAGDVIWPKPHSALFDFEATRRGAAWIDAIAADALATLWRSEGRLVVGHDDWSAKNMRMRGDRIAVVYDWDSVLLGRETAILGTAAAHFPMTWEIDVPGTPPIEAMSAFVREYERARGKTFSASEIAEIEAGASYARAYKARCEHAIDPVGADWAGSSRERLKADGPIRF